MGAQRERQVGDERLALGAMRLSPELFFVAGPRALRTHFREIATHELEAPQVPVADAGVGTTPGFSGGGCGGNAVGTRATYHGVNNTTKNPTGRHGRVRDTMYCHRTPCRCLRVSEGSTSTSQATLAQSPSTNTRRSGLGHGQQSTGTNPSG